MSGRFGSRVPGAGCRGLSAWQGSVRKGCFQPEQQPTYFLGSHEKSSRRLEHLEICGENQICLQFAKTASGDSKKLQVFTSRAPAITFGDVRRNRNRRATHLGSKAEALLERHIPGFDIEALGELHGSLPGYEVTVRTQCFRRESNLTARKPIKHPAPSTQHPH